MNKKNIFIGLILSALMFTSCVGDLDVKPLDEDIIMAGNLSDDPEYMKMVLGKIYASFIISGQGANGGDNAADIRSSDDNFFTTMRAYWNLQEITTDEAMCAWSDVGISDLNTQAWSPSNSFLTAVYQRLAVSITYANDFIAYNMDNEDATVQQYVAEARFLRALAYSWAIDLFGKFPFANEEQGVGKFFPEIQTREYIFNYIETELLDIEDKLGAPGFSYPQADQATAWMLLARLYLNAEVYTGTPRWGDVITYVDKVEASTEYRLADDYRMNFTADNDHYNNPEMIFAFEADGIHTQGYVGTTFIIESCSDGTYLRAEDFHGLTANTNWNGNRARIDFMNVLVDTIATYGNVPVPTNDPFFEACPDNRVYLRTKLSNNIPSTNSNGDYGIGVYKFTALKFDGNFHEHHDPAYASTDFPIFRYADALLMRAEANMRLGSPNLAMPDVNAVRARAYGDASGNVSAAQITEEFMLNERGREFYYEAQRRTDLVRFGQFTDGSYHWQWKGGVFEGVPTSSHLNIFPIPADEISANPNYNGINNPGY